MHQVTICDNVNYKLGLTRRPDHGRFANFVYIVVTPRVRTILGALKLNSRIFILKIGNFVLAASRSTYCPCVDTAECVINEFRQRIRECDRDRWIGLFVGRRAFCCLIAELLAQGWYTKWFLFRCTKVCPNGRFCCWHDVCVHLLRVHYGDCACTYQMTYQPSIFHLRVRNVFTKQIGRGIFWVAECCNCQQCIFWGHCFPLT